MADDLHRVPVPLYDASVATTSDSSLPASAPISQLTVPGRGGLSSAWVSVPSRAQNLDAFSSTTLVFDRYAVSFDELSRREVL